MAQKSLLKNLGTAVSRPFRNLTIPQRVLQFVRLGTGILTLVFTITLFFIRGQTSSAYIARINCSHLEVASGLYESLRTSISDSPSHDSNQLLTDLTLTDSEITILTKYTQNQVSNAPQYILLGYSECCYIDYTTYFNSPEKHLHRNNLTTHCESYYPYSMFDYRELLEDQGLAIILAYALKTKIYNDTSYTNTVISRDKKFHALRIVAIVQFVAQILVLVSTIVVYSYRGPSKDLSLIPPITLNFVAILSMLAGLTMVASFSMVTQEILAMQRDVHNELSSFGIEMLKGRVFFTILCLNFAFACLCMLSWIIPLWCSNPPQLDYLSDDEYFDNHHDTTSIMEREHEFVVKPYQPSRQMKRNNLNKSQSRLFDDAHEELYSGEVTGDEGYDANGKTGTHEGFKEHTETELRKLGEKMSKKLSVRRANRQMKKTITILPQKVETHQLLYRDNPFSNHQYPQELPKRQEDDGLTRKASVAQPTRNLSDGVLRTRVLPESEKRNEGTSKDTQRFLDTKENRYRDDEVSLLDEQEMDYLESNHFVNKLS